MTAPGAALGNQQPEENPVFTATVEDHGTETFLTLQRAMNWVEEFERPTGTISFLGQAIVSYSQGEVNVVRR
jgi:hypothetical protein